MLVVDDGGSIDWIATRETITSLCAAGVAGIYSNGTACEFHCQTEAEFDRLTELVADVAGQSNTPFQIGVSQSNPRVARERARRAAGVKPAGLQFTLPDWWPPSDKEVVRFAAGLSDACDGIPLVLYNPPHAKRRLTIDGIATLRAAVPAVIGAKLPGGGADWFAQARDKLPGFSVFVPGHSLASGYNQGAHGSYSNVACLSPSGALAWWDDIVAENSEALETEQRVQRFIAEHVLPFRARYQVSDAALDKAMASAGGWGAMRPDLLWPYSSVPHDEIAPLSRAARAAFPDWF